MESSTEITGTVERVIFKSEESGFLVFTLKIGSQDPITVRGSIGQLHQGTQVTIKGSWTFHPKFGRQFEALECTTSFLLMPSASKDIYPQASLKVLAPNLQKDLSNHLGKNIRNH
jgi:exodeoxyribonuclease V alpha subunit